MVDSLTYFMYSRPEADSGFDNRIKIFVSQKEKKKEKIKIKKKKEKQGAFKE